jgi:hypothetical protein
MRAALLVLSLMLCACSSKSSHSKSSTGGSAGAGAQGGAAGVAGVGGSAGSGGTSAAGGAGGVACTPCQPQTSSVPSGIDPVDMVLWTSVTRLAFSGGALPTDSTGAIKLCAPSNLNCAGAPITHTDPFSAADVFDTDLFVAAKNRVARITPNQTTVTQLIPDGLPLAFTISELTVDAEHLFVTAGLGVTRLARSDGTSRLLDNLYQVKKLSSVGNRVYFTSDSAFGAFDKPAAGGSGFVQMDELLQIKSEALVAVSEGEVYFASAGAASDVFASDGTLPGTNKLNATSASFAPISVLFMAKSLFVGTWEGDVARLPVEPDAVPIPLAKFNGPVLALAAEGQMLFALVGGGSKKVVQIGSPTSCCM